MNLIIDGYNLLPESGCKDREELIQVLVAYRRRQGHEITLVFDGTHGGLGDYGHADTGSIKVVYTPLTVQADDHIEDLLEKLGGQNTLVVSSDRRLQRAAKNSQSFWAYSKEFARKLRQSGSAMSESQAAPWLEGREEIFDKPSKKDFKKKGSAFRPSQEERRRLKKIDLL